ncbi:MAG: sulfatase [Planctomycetaceae bacterium]|nr:sulfatase [Planctomycetaceae bacterium]
MSRIHLTICLFLSYFFVGFTQAKERPNILFIFTDDQSHRTVSCYDQAYDWVNTPNIDQLASTGVRFDQAYIGTWCMPSRATQLTGYHQFGVESMRMKGEYPGSTYDPRKTPFWPSIFRRHGYITAQIGKWHTGVDNGYGRDWDYQIVWNRPAHPDNAGNYFDDQIVEINGVSTRVQGYTTDWYTERADQFIRGDQRDDQQPWYLWLCFGAVHGPFTPAKRHFDAYPNAEVPVPKDIFTGANRADKPKYVQIRDRWVLDKNGIPELKSGVQQRTVKNAPIHGNSLQNWVRQYQQGVLAIDDAVGKLVATLKETGQYENTLIVFASDQGIAWGQKGFQQKIAPYDANIRGPLIISYPEKIREGGVVKAPVGGVDLPPTFFHYAGLPLPWKMHGHNLAPILKNPEKKWRHPTLTVMTGQNYGSATDIVPTDESVLLATAKVPWWLSLADGDFKYIRTLVENEVEELYDLKSDPDELVNLALKPEYLPQLRSMRAATIAELKRTDAGMVENLPGFSTPK